MPLSGGSSIVVDTAVTSIVLTLLVTLFTASGVRHALQDGLLTATDGFPRAVGSHCSGAAAGDWRCLRPHTATFGSFHVLGFSGLSFAGFALFKAVYTGPLAFALRHWVILRQLLRYSL